MRILGVDPGSVNAAVSVIEDGECVFTYKLKVDVVKTKYSTKKMIDIPELRSVLLKLKPIDKAYMEDVHAMPNQSIVSMFNFGKAVGILESMLYALDIPTVKVTPKTWQKILEGDTELNNCSTLFPDTSFLKSKKSKVPDPNMIDSALIAYYGYINECSE